MKKQLQFFVFTSICIFVVSSCQQSPDKKWAQNSYAKHEAIVDQLDSFLIKEFKAYNPITEATRALILDSAQIDSNTNFETINTIRDMEIKDFQLKSIEQEVARQSIFEDKLNTELKASGKIKFWKFHYRLKNDATHYSFDCNNWTGTYNENIDPDDGFQIDGRKIGWGLFQPIDENGDFEKRGVQGLHVRLYVSTKEAVLYADLILFD